MAQPFLRIDLSNQAKDFQNTVIEAGWPLIDKANANYQILRKWLGASVAEPERKGEEVLFYLRNESGARIDEPSVAKATDKDLTGTMKSDFQALIKKLQAADPKNTSEKTLHAKALQELQALATEKRAGDRRCCLFKYRDEKKQWHLVWAPGYRRKDEQPANPLICTNPTCSFLFLQRSDGNSKCPRCQKTPGVRPAESTGVKKSMLPLALVLLLLIAALGGAGWWYFNREQGDSVTPAEATLAVTPAEATITQDGQIEYKVTFTDAEGNETDVTDKVSVMVSAKGENPSGKAPVKYDIFQNKAEAKGVGTAELAFNYFDESNTKYTAIGTLVVEPRRNPKVVTIVPDSVKLGVGTTAQLKMMGEYEDGRKEDLTNAAEWNWEDLGPKSCVFAYKGAVQGVNKGEMQLKARYRATPESDYIIAEAKVVVDDLAFKSLNLALASDKIAIGQDPGVSVDVVSESGDKLSVLGSALLKLEVEPKELAEVQKQPPYLYPKEEGRGTLRAIFRGLTKEIPFEVKGAKSSEAVAFQVSPQNLKLAVGEIADVDVPKGTGNDEVKFSSSELNVVEITSHNRLIGKTPGKANVTVKRGDQSATINVEVASVPFKGLKLEPGEVSVRVDDVAALRLLAKIDDDTDVELDPLLPTLEWVRYPDTQYVEVNKGALDVRGLLPTGDDAKTLSLRLGQHEASAKIKVIPGPLTLALEPAESVEVAVGQKQPLKVFATYGNGERQEIPANRVEWIAEPAEGLSLQNGEIVADKPDAGPLLVSARYQGQTSNEVEVRSVHSPPLKLTLSANPAQLAVNETGQLVLSGKTPGGQDATLDLAGATFQSGDESVIEVNPATGGFRALAEGKATVTATHPTSMSPVTAEIQVTAAVPMTSPLPMPDGVRLVVEGPEPIVLPVGVAYVDLKVEAAINGQPQDVTPDSRISVEGDPSAAPVAIRDGQIVAIRPGEATVTAEFNGMKAENTVKFQVTDKLELDSLVAGPPDVTLSINENTRLDAIGMLQGRRVGLVTDHPEITWKSSDASIAQTEGPLVTALSAGTAQVTAQFQSVTSNPVPIQVLGEGAGPVADILTVTPASITLRPGESVQIGQGVRVLRGNADLSRQAIVAPANEDIVSYDEATRRLSAGLPGRTRVAVVVGEQTANLDVIVLTDAPPAEGGFVVIEPASGIIAVGEQLPIQVFLHTKDGQRYNVTSSALLGSSDPRIGAISGTSVQGVAPGQVTVTAQVRGAASPANATFQVQNLEFTHLEVNPSQFDLTVGQRLWYEIYAVGPAGRRLLGNDPDLKITHVHLDGREEELGFPHMVEGKWPTQDKTETIKIRWKDLQRDVAFRVRDDRITGLVIRPDDANLEVGDSLDYQLFVRRGGQLQPLSNLDGAQLAVSNPVIASQAAALRVRGESEGVTEVIAQYAGQQARARLRVIPRTTPVAPPGRPVALRIHPDTFQMELGTSGSPVRVVRLNSDGTTEEVAHLSEITTNPEGIVEIRSTPSGPVMFPKAIGQTQIHAKLGDLQTETPMLVDVTDELPGRPRVLVDPSVVRVNVGETAGLGRVAILPAQGGPAIELPYKVTATPNNFFTVDNNRVIRGTAPGQAIANVTIDDPDSKYNGEPGTVIVQVNELPTNVQLSNQSGLELRGPTSTTEGSEVEFRVDVVDGSTGQDVTSDATLVLAVGDERFAELQPGCKLIAKQPGNVTVRARYNGMVSNTIPLTINPLATNFRQLELDLRTDPLGVGETRGYRVWGHPASGGPRQDLTRLIQDNPNDATRPHIRFTTLEPNASANVAAHNSPSIVGRNPGKVSVQAAIGDRLQSNVAEVPVVAVIRNPVDLRVEPGSITSRVGETTPPLKVLVRTQGDSRYRELDPALADYVSEDTDIAAPVENEKGRFTAQRPGQARIRISYEGLQTAANVSVVADRFQKVELGDPKFAENTFTVPLTVRTDRVAGNLEYRVYRPGEELKPDEGWQDTTAQGDTQFVKLNSPEFNVVQNNLFRVVIESRDKSTKNIDRYPYAFRLTAEN